MGSPCKVIRELDDRMRDMLTRPTQKYVKNWKRFAADLTLLPDE